MPTAIVKSISNAVLSEYVTFIVLSVPSVQYTGLALTVSIAVPVLDPLDIVIVLLSPPIEAVAIESSEEDTSNLLELSFPDIITISDGVLLYTVLVFLDNENDDDKLVSGILEESFEISSDH